MALFGMKDKNNTEGDIQARNDKLENELEKIQKEQDLVESDYREALQNLTSVALGTNQELDFQLKRLEVQLRNNNEAKQLCTTTEIIQELKKESNASFGSELRGILKQLIDYSFQLPNADKIQKDISSIERGLENASNLELPNLMRSLTTSLKKTVEINIEQNKPKPWYQSIFRSKSTLDLKPITTILKYLLNHMTIPTCLAEEHEQLQLLIQTNMPADSSEAIKEEDVIQALDLTSQLVIKAHRLNQRQFNHFIEEINSQISVMEELLFKQEQNNFIHKEENNTFDNSIAENFQELQENIQASQNIEILKKNVTGSLNSMMDKVKNYSTKQAKRINESEQQVKQLNEKVRETELVTNQLIEELSKTSQEALSDALTGLPNRAAYDKRVEEEFARWQRFKHPLTIIVCDIDLFKKVNDTFGHKAGDKVIQTLGKTLKDSLRKVDFVGRYGGEEFVILLEKTSLSNALDVAEKIRRKIADLGFHFNDQPVKVSSSFGLTQFKEGDNIDTAFERADQALYKSKENGRNKVTHTE